MQATVTSRGLSRAPAATFKPRINIRSVDSAEDLLKYGPLHVARFGVMPDGFPIPEINLGLTVNTSLAEALVMYWQALFMEGFMRWASPWWMPHWVRVAVMKWYPVEVKGYEMTPLPPLKKQ